VPFSLSWEPAAIRVEGFGGVGINAWDHGGDGPPLILVHCTGTHARVWDPLLPPLRERFRVYAVDTRGHGDSDKPADPDAYTWSNGGRDLLAVVDALAVGPKVHVAGHSAGAAHWCYAELERPGTIGKTVLIDPVIAPPGLMKDSPNLAEGARRRRSTFPSFDDAIENFSAKPPLGAWDRDVLECYVRHGFVETGSGEIELKCPGSIEAAVYERGGSSDIFHRLGEIEADISLVTADRSNLFPFAEAQHGQFRPHQYTVLEGVSHFIPQEVPAETVRLLLAHLT